MKKILLWPAISTAIFLLYQLYEAMYPCRDGLFIGDCGSSRILIVLFITETWLVSILISLILLLIEKKRGKSIHQWIYVLAGLIGTIVLLVNALSGGINASVLLFVFSHLSAAR